MRGERFFLSVWFVEGKSLRKSSKVRIYIGIEYSTEEELRKWEGGDGDFTRLLETDSNSFLTVLQPCPGFLNPAQCQRARQHDFQKARLLQDFHAL